MDDNNKNPDMNSEAVPTEGVPPTIPETPEATVAEAPGMATETTAETVPGEAIADAAVPERKKNRSGLVALLIVLAMIVIAASAFWYQKTHTSNPVSLGGKDYPAVVAVVNGETVTGAQFEQSYQQAESIATQQGFDVSDTEVQQQVEDQALAVLINTVLIVQAAKDAGYTASDEEVDTEVAKLETQFGGSEQLASVLASAGLTEDSVRDDLADQVVVDKFLNASEEWGSVAVTEEEKRAFYDQVAGFSSTTPPYEEVESMVEEQLLSQKQQDATQTIIDRLRSEADIEERI